MGVGSFFKNLPKNIAKYGWKGVKIASQHADLLPVVGAPVIVAKVLKGTMAIAEARGGKNKAISAVLLAVPLLQELGLDKIPKQKLHLIVELLRDPDFNEGEFDYPDLEAKAKEMRDKGWSKEQEELLQAIENAMKEG
jgi:hypothetical protein